MPYVYSRLSVFQGHLKGKVWMKGILPTACNAARSGENGLLLLHLLPIFLKSVFAYPIYIVLKIVILLTQSLINSFDINIY